MHVCDSFSAQQRDPFVCLHFAVQHCSERQPEAQDIPVTSPDILLSMTQQLSPAWRGGMFAAHRCCFRPQSETLKCLLPIQNFKKRTILFMRFLHKHLCEPRAALVCCATTAFVAPSHFVQPGGSRAVLTLPKMRTKRALTAQRDQESLLIAFLPAVNSGLWQFNIHFPFKGQKGRLVDD